MVFCPDDLEPCQRVNCRAGHCERTTDAPLVICWECGELVAGHSKTYVCVECVRRYTPVIEEGN